MERRRLAGIGIAVPFHRDKISECYDQLTNPTLKKVRTTPMKHVGCSISQTRHTTLKKS